MSRPRSPQAKRPRLEEKTAVRGPDTSTEGGGADAVDDWSAGVGDVSAAVLELVSAAPSPSLTSSSVRSSIARLRRCAASNAELRLRFASSPLRFLDSEVELHDAVRAVAAVATSPELYPTFLECRGLEEVVPLLAHDNADIANAAVSSLHDLLDAETLQTLDNSAAEAARQRLVQLSSLTTDRSARIPPHHLRAHRSTIRLVCQLSCDALPALFRHASRLVHTGRQSV